MYMGMGRMTVRERAIIESTPHDGYCRSVSFDCGEMGRVQNIEAPRRGRIVKGKSRRGTRADD